MAKDERLFAPFPIEMDEHPKIIGLSDAAFRAVFEATFYSRRMLSDGFLDERVVLKRWGLEVAAELSSNDPERPSWVRVESPRPGWRIHDFEKHHPLRAEIEEKRRDLAEKRSEAGRRGNAKRWDANRSQPDRKPVANDRSETETETKTETAKDKAIARFAEFWEVYPRKADKRTAQTAFLTAAKRADLDLILDGARRYAADPNREDAFTKHPATWLRADGWANGPLPPREGGQSRDARALSTVEIGQRLQLQSERLELS